MAEFKCWVSIGMASPCNRSFRVIIDDEDIKDMSENDIDEVVREQAEEYFSYWFERVR